MSVGIARLPWTQFFKLIWAREANMTAYYILLHFWLKVGSSEFFVRSLSVIFGIATVAALDRLGRELFGQTTGWIAASLLALNAWHIAASQEARGYSLAMFALTVSAYLLARFLTACGESGVAPKDSSMPYALVSALAVYSHFYSTLVIFSQWVVIPFAKPRAAQRREIFRAARFFLYSVAPLAIFIVIQGSGQLGWITGFHGALLRQFAIELTGGSGIAQQILYSLALVLGGFAAIRSALKYASGDGVWPSLLAWAWLVLPVALVLIASELWKPLFFPRYLIIVLPAFALVAASGIVITKPRWVFGAFVLAMLALSVQAVRVNRDAYFEFGRDDWRSATSYVLSESRVGDAAIFFSAPSRLPFEYYRQRFAANSALTVISPAHGSSPGKLDYRDFEPEPLAETFQSLPENYARVWLVVSPFNPDLPANRGTIYLMHWCEARYHLAAENRFNGIDVLLYAKP